MQSQNFAGTALIAGKRKKGLNLRAENLHAVMSIANLVRSSFGPMGLDKLLVDDIGEILITNDGATIVDQLDVKHPASKLIIQLTQLQNKEVGDGTTSVVLIAAELVSTALNLIKHGLHPSTIISGYKLASKEAVSFIKREMTHSISQLGDQVLVNIAKTSINSKVLSIGKEYFAKMIVKAVKSIKVNTKKGNKYPPNSINILKCHGKSLKESELIEGFALNCTCASQGMPKFIKKAKIALLDFSLKKQKMGLSVHVQVEDPDELEQIRRREMDIPKERIEMLFKAGVNIILTTGSISNDCLKYFERAGAMGVRHCNRSDLVQLSKSVGGKVLLSLVDLNGNESFESSWIGYSDEVKQESVCNSELLIFKSRKKNIQNRSIILRGPNRFMLDEVHRSVNDAISIVSKTLESSKVVPGGGAIEAGLSIYLEKFSRTVGSIEQVAISQFAKSLLVIPKTLAVNSACDSIELVSKLRACHNTGQVKKKPKLLQIGLDLENNKLLNSIKNGIVEPLVLKIKMLKFATEAAITVLRIDEFIELYPEENKGNEKNDEENN